MADTLANADFSYLIAPKDHGSGAASIAGWEFDDLISGSSISGLSDVISRQSSEPASPEVRSFDDPPPFLHSLQSFSSVVSPVTADWGAAEQPRHGLITRSAESMVWARSGAAAVAAEVEAEDGSAGKKKDVPPAAKKARRREQQKVAQQRYRQKQRHWAVDTEVKVDELNEQHKAVKAERAKLVARRATLEDELKGLEATVTERSAQVATLRERLGASQPATKVDGTCAAEPPQTAADVAGRLSDSVYAIRACIQQHSCKEGECDSPTRLPELQRLLQDYHSAAAAQHPKSPEKVPNERGVATGVVMDHGRGAKQHDGITKALQLTPVQRKTLSWIRERQISKIADLTEARRELNMRAMTQMLPTLTAHGLERQLGSLSMAGGLAVLPEATELDASIDAIKANIAEERQAAAELQDLVLHRALEPLQAATLIVESSPGRPDVFALIDAVSRGHGSDKKVTQRGDGQQNGQA